MEFQLWHCSDCGDEREFVQPTCTDGHTEDGGPCPDWACVDCGAALVTGVAPRALAGSGLTHAA